MTSPANAVPPDAGTWAAVDRIFEDWRIDAHVPGLVHGVVIGAELVHVEAVGIQDVDAERPVTASTLFRIASMSKAFTALAILKLRDDGKLSLDAPAETYVPQMKGWAYATADSRRIRVRDLIHHIGGFVTDDPWGDRQQALSEDAFTAMLAGGVPFANAVGVAMEYSNFGYALLGRIIGNVSGRRYQDYIRDTLMKPLGMTSTGYDIAVSPPDRRARGYRWQDHAWLAEPDMEDGVFGAMGGVETCAADYARWLSFLLSAWPARDDADAGPVARATVREIVEGSNFTARSTRPAPTGATPHRTAVAYAMGWSLIEDPDLGRVLAHGGGYPGYGSYAVLLPDRGAALFALTNRTYAGPAPQVFKAALAMRSSGLLPEERSVETGSRVLAGYEIARALFAAGDVAAVTDRLAVNFLLDRDAAHWATELARLRKEVGPGALSEPVSATSAMGGTFTWACAHGRIKGSFQLAPTTPATLQTLSLDVVKP
jgi:D-alanyl-D-alanine-carboxypeptidase/D-alanyl-D-alanine-endopeptidase